ncbi:MAG: methyltransferase [Candidatus Thermoplasmatota archaeon]|nr:methyltransferase [Candidatus Thermoplasmatota archaeon]
MGYKPRMSEKDIEIRKQWHDSVYRRIEDQKTIRRQYLGRKIVVPKEVFPPAWMSKLLGKTILDEVKESDRVLDMGTGSGINAILAASNSSNVVAVDVNTYCLDAGTRNAEKNGVGSKIEFRESDLFNNVNGAFDLIIFDPLFRWFAPRDIRGVAVADENFRTVTAFFNEVRNYLKPGGRILIFYGDSGDNN